MPVPVKQRIAYLDWMRGLACVLMFQTHCYDSWLSPAARKGSFYRWSQLGGTLPAPLFLFLTGITAAMIADRLRQRGLSVNEIASTTIRCGAEIFGLGLLFRVQEFVLGLPKAPWTDLLRVDILNTIGISLMLVGVFFRLASKRTMAVAFSAITAAGIAIATPPLWSTRQPRWLPWFLESYINGVHNLGKPQPRLFPLFPWCGFVFVGLAIGSVLQSSWSRRRPVATMLLLAAAGACFFALGYWLDAWPVQLYAVYDFWHTSPNFFLMRVGMLLVIVFLSYWWCRWGAGQWGLAPLIEMGQASLLIYWVHMEFVYGRFSILPKRGVDVATASLGLLAIFVAMTILAIMRRRLKGRRSEILARFQRAPGTAPEH